MDKYKSQKLNPEGINTLNRCIELTEIETVIKAHPTKKSPGTMTSLQNSNNYFRKKKAYLNSPQDFPSSRKEGNSLKLYMKSILP